MDDINKAMQESLNKKPSHEVAPNY